MIRIALNSVRFAFLFNFPKKRDFRRQPKDREQGSPSAPVIKTFFSSVLF